MNPNYEIPFTQYMRPNGRRVANAIERPKEIYEKARQIIDAGFCFEVEVLSTGPVSMTIADDECDHEVEVVGNGPEVPLAVDRMIERFWKKKINQGR